MRKILWILLMCAVVASAAAQSTSSKYQPGLIMSVEQHPELNAATDSPKRYDIAIKVGNTIYSVLYTPPPGTYGFQYSAGQEILVSVGPKTITYNDMLGRSRAVPIVSRSTAPEKAVPNRSHQ
jgi:hypothetical protein